jgi:hypothetical protein
MGLLELAPAIQEELLFAKLGTAAAERRLRQITSAFGCAQQSTWRPLF